MEILYIGVNRRVGVSAKTGKPYDICELNYLVPDEPAIKVDEAGKELWNYTAFGKRPQSIECDPNCIQAFSDVKSPAVVTIQVEPRPNNPSRNWVTGLN